MTSGKINVSVENIFPLIKKFLYSDHEIFLRELISNGTDATLKLKHLTSIGEAKTEYGNPIIEIKIDKEGKKLHIIDQGIGMTSDEVEKYINQLAFSGAEEFLNKYEDSAKDSGIIGHFGLGFYILLEAVIFLPLIKIATLYAGPQVIFQAAMLTVAMFSGISFVAFTSNRDFSFLRNIIVIGGFISLGLIVGGMLFGFNLGLWFSVGMVILASATILYQTSKLKDSYSTNQYVGASLQLFASIMLLFWYILSILMSRRS